MRTILIVATLGNSAVAGAEYALGRNIPAIIFAVLTAFFAGAFVSECGYKVTNRFKRNSRPD
jgi:high-affinity Fe2+/Pb2+ permease